MSHPKARKARRSGEHRAFSLLEMAVVIVLIGLIGAAAIGRFGSATLQNISAEGYARRLALELTHARQATVATGDNHYIALTESSGVVTSYTVVRRAAGGDQQVAPDIVTPSGLTVVASHSNLEFDFDGAALAAYSVAVDGPARSWAVAATPLTGLVQTTETTP